MFIYKATITYNNNFKEIIEIKEKSRSLAEKKCEEIIKQNKALIEKHENLNVYISNFMRKVELLKETMYDEVSKISKIIEE